MKYLRVKIKREQNPGGGTHYVYPPQYDAKKVKDGPHYETFNPDKIAGVKARPVPHEYCVLAVEDIDATGFLASPDIEEINEADYVFNGEDFSAPAEEFIDDEREVLRVLDKVKKGLPLSPVDLDAIDGEKPGKGVKKQKSFTERWNARKTELGV